ncbi:MAG: PDC sensor domain-containing protein [Gammaproteobacteria bacterium]|nr:PDC sensor domain-containing protein [Gammaproteobacteria bacterium]
MTTPLDKSIARQRASLINMLVDPLGRLAVRLAAHWGDQEVMAEQLQLAINEIPWVKFLYALNPQAVQISATASKEGLNVTEIGRDRSTRPYMLEAIPKGGLLLSEAYISLRENRPSVTAIQQIVDEGGQLLGILGADFDLRALPLTRELYQETTTWRQLKGDPAIRGTLFKQSRFESLLDADIDKVLPVVEELMIDRGVFHSKIHFSSSRLTLWHVDDPFRYRLLNIEQLLDPDTCLAYPMRPYPSEALIAAESIRQVLDTFVHLRMIDSTIYLRGGSINIFNGIIGLNFSCDGSHYIPISDFLARDSNFWQGLQTP